MCGSGSIGPSLPFARDSSLSPWHQRALKISYNNHRYAAFPCYLSATTVLAYAQLSPFYPLPTPRCRSCSPSFYITFKGRAWGRGYILYTLMCNFPTELIVLNISSSIINVQQHFILVSLQGLTPPPTK